MLVIRRRPGESLVIGEDVEIEIIECGATRVKLGIRAPRRIPVTRSELRMTRAQNLTAARSLDSIEPSEVASMLERVRP